MPDLTTHHHLIKSRNIKPLNEDVWSDTRDPLDDEKQTLSEITRVSDLNTLYDDRTPEHIVRNSPTDQEELYVWKRKTQTLS